MLLKTSSDCWHYNFVLLLCIKHSVIFQLRTNMYVKIHRLPFYIYISARKMDVIPPGPPFQILCKDDLLRLEFFAQVCNL